MAHYCVQILKPKQFVPFPIKSVHNKPSLDETNKTDLLHSISRPKPMNPTSNGSRTHHHVRTMAPRTLTRAAADSQLPAWISVTHTTKTALSSTDLFGLRIWWSYDVTRSHTRRLDFWLLLHAPVNITRSSQRRKLLLMSSDVTG